MFLKDDKYFISYSKKDSSSFAIKLATALKERGFKVWLDQLDIKGGLIWDTAIQKALDEAGCVIILLSESSVSSNNVLDEASYALNRKKKVIPILLHDCAIPYRLDRIQYIDFRYDYDTGLANLIRTLDEEAGERQTVEPVPPPAKPGKRHLPLWLIVTGIGVLLAAAILLLKNVSNEPAPDHNKSDTPVVISSKHPPKKDTTHRVIPHVIVQPNNNPIEVFSSAPYRARYLVKDDKLVLYINCPNSDLAVEFDVNQNGIADPSVDRGYSVRGSNPAQICLAFVTGINSFTNCGAKSAATASFENATYVIAIPLNEIRSSAQARTISLQFSFISNRIVNIPQRTSMNDFSRVFKIDIP